jgi:peptidyl-prolyl cis-trans isomerase SurA
MVLCAALAWHAAAPAQTQQGHVPRPGEEAGQAKPRAAPRIEIVDRIVAVVGKEVVTKSELDERREFAERQLRRQGTPLPERALLERQILERLIVDKAQLQLARDSGIRVEETQLDRALERVAEQNRMTLPQFRQALEKDGVAFARFREEVRQQIQMQRLREREVDDRIEVSDAEIDQYLTDQKAGAGARSEYNLAHVLVRLPEQTRSRGSTLPRSRRATRTPPTRSPAARSAGAARTDCRSCSPPRCTA